MDHRILAQSAAIVRLLVYAIGFCRAHFNAGALKARKHSSERGQSMVIIAVAFVALLAFVGLVVDVGQLYISMGHLRRAVDAGSLAAAAQYREGRGHDQMRLSAEEILDMNGVDPTVVVVETCETNPGDAALCTTPRRKLVRVYGETAVPTVFLQLVGVNNINIHADAIGEAAAMDVILVVDISESMANDAGYCDGDDDDGDGVADDGRPEGMCGQPAVAQVGPRTDNFLADPSRCNSGRECQPMEDVKAAAETFVDRILDLPPNEEADRLAIVTFSNGWEPEADQKGTRVVPPGWITNRSSARNAIRNLKVYQPEVCDSSVGPCRNYDTGNASGNFLGFECPVFRRTGDPASCTTTNIGGGLLEAGNLFALEPRPEALWAVILLTDGTANASDPSLGHDYGFCPDTSWTPPFCRDTDHLTRHASGSPAYDADDYARDMADFVGCLAINPVAACPEPGQGGIIFAVGLGDQVTQLTASDPVPHGVSLLRYIAAVGDDGDPGTNPCEGLYDNRAEWETWCGNYYFEAHGTGLNRVFEDIASRMFTRITH